MDNYYNDDDETYIQIIKERKYKCDKNEIYEYEIEKVKEELKQINEAYNKLIEILINKNIL